MSFVLDGWRGDIEIQSSKAHSEIVLNVPATCTHDRDVWLHAVVRVSNNVSHMMSPDQRGDKRGRPPAANACLSQDKVSCLTPVYLPDNSIRPSQYISDKARRRMSLGVFKTAVNDSRSSTRMERDVHSPILNPPQTSNILPCLNMDGDFESSPKFPPPSSSTIRVTIASEGKPGCHSRKTQTEVRRLFVLAKRTKVIVMLSLQTDIDIANGPRVRDKVGPMSRRTRE